MKGDFSRDSFDARRSVYRVLMQQGRVQLDADWNEQAATMLHRLETTVRDMFGPCGGPQDRCGFALFAPSDGDAGGDFAIGAGRYYVDGLLVENFRPETFGARLERGHPYIIYLDVWEEFVSPQQDPALIDPALDGLDTTARTRVEWRVRAHRVTELPSREEIAEDWPYGYLAAAPLEARGRLAASVNVHKGAYDSAFGALRGGYQGSENRLYRVEIHQPGAAADGATFKWSRDNGSVVFSIQSLAGNVVTLAVFGRDGAAQIAPGDWVEICDDDDAARESPARGLFAVTQTDPGDRTIGLKPTPEYTVDPAKHPVLRRWDQGTAPLRVIEGADLAESWIELEAGLAIRFEGRDSADGAANYRSGDYWMIPARTAGGSLLWPLESDGRPALREPAGVQHHFAPLGGVYITASGKMIIDRKRHDYRNRFSPLSDRL